jgi:hypothetical protein
VLGGRSPWTLDVMRSAICLIAALASAGSAARADVSECQPKRAILSIAPADCPSTRVPYLGYIDVAFPVQPTGNPEDLTVISSHVDSSEALAHACALNVVANARFDPPHTACRQMMRIRFTVK